MIKHVLFFISFLVIGINLYGQNSNIAEKAYIDVVKEGPSTGPLFIVVNINNLNTGVSNEVCTDISTLFWALSQENNTSDREKYLLSKSSDRNFDFKDQNALNRLNFSNYKLNKEKKIKILIEKKHLRDSLNKLVNFYEIERQAFYKYADQRQNLLKEVRDSISTVRSLTSEEDKMISNLKDRYYDDYYSKSEFNKYRTISPHGQSLMKIWKQKIEKYKKEFSKFEIESERMYNKFFQKYYKMFGISFCHIAFKYGIITYLGDENRVVGFSKVI